MIFSEPEQVDVTSLHKLIIPLVHETKKILRANGQCFRDGEGLHIKFDKVASAKKSSGDPSCLEHVWIAKQIARDILQIASAGKVGSSDDEFLANEHQGLIACKVSDRKRNETSQSIVLDKDSNLHETKNKIRHNIGARAKQKKCIADTVGKGIGAISQSVNCLVDVLAKHGKEEIFDHQDT